MGELKNFRLNDEQARVFSHLKNTLKLKTDASLFRFLLDCGYEKVFGNEEEREKILKELSKFKKDHQYFLKYLDAITESLTIVDNRNKEIDKRNKEYRNEIDGKLSKNYQAILETLKESIKSNTGFRQDPEKLFEEAKSNIESK